MACWPVSMYDSTILQSCGLCQYLGRESIGWLVADSGYLLRPYLMTPKVIKLLLNDVIKRFVLGICSIIVNFFGSVLSCMNTVKAIQRLSSFTGEGRP